MSAEGGKVLLRQDRFQHPALAGKLCACTNHPPPPKTPSFAEGGEIPLRHDRISNLVEHPVLVEPPTEAPPPPPQPLKLTKRELKKLRTQVRD